MAKRTETQLKKWTPNHVLKTLDATQYINMKSIDNFIYQVKGGTKDRVVNLHEKTCTCCKFDLDLLLYAYACVAINYLY